MLLRFTSGRWFRQTWPAQHRALPCLRLAAGAFPLAPSKASWHWVSWAFVALLLLSFSGRALSAAPSGPSAAEARSPILITDDTGRKIQFKRPPQRIVSLMPSLTETVCALGGCERLVGVDRFSNHPAAVKALPHLGGLDDTSLEALLALQPDVVLLTPYSRLHTRLRQLRIPTLVFETRNQAEMRMVLHRVGLLLGDPPAGERLWAQIQAGVDEIAKGLPASARGLSVYMEIDSSPYAAGTTSFMGEILSRLGARNIVDASMGPFPKLNPEFVVKAAPQVIMLGERGPNTLAQRPGWAGIPAIRQGRVCQFPPEVSEMMARPGPRMVESARHMATCLAGKTEKAGGSEAAKSAGGEGGKKGASQTKPEGVRP